MTNLMRKVITCGIFAVVFLATLGLTSSSAAADNSNKMPEPTNFTGNKIRLLVSNTSPGNSLVAPMSRVKIYSTKPDLRLNIYGLAHCGTDSLDNDTNVFSYTNYKIYKTDSAENQSGSPSFSVNNTHDCVYSINTPYSIHITSSALYSPKSTVVGHEQWYVYIFQADLSAGGVNGFTLEAPDSGSLIGYSNDSTDQFALQNRDAPPGGYTDFSLPFAADCTVKNSVSIELKWFDDDWGNLQTNSDFTFKLHDATDGSDVALTGNGQNGVKLYHPKQGPGKSGIVTGTINSRHKYVWQWFNVANDNGIQFRLPYDSIFYNTICDPIVDGVKIDDSGVSATGTAAGYGGTAVFNTDRVYAYTDAAMTTLARGTNTNPFYFRDHSSSIPAYNTGLSGGTKYWFKDLDAGSHPGWTLRGYTYCEGTSCGSDDLTKLTNIRAGDSFSVTLQNRDQYHVRFIYENTGVPPTANLTLSCTTATSVFGDADKYSASSADLYTPGISGTHIAGLVKTSDTGVSTQTTDIRSYPDGTQFTLVSHNIKPDGSAVGSGDAIDVATKPNCTPVISGLVAVCNGSISGSAFDQSNSAAPVTINIIDTGTNRTTTTTATPGFSVPISNFDNPYQDGADHAFSVTAVDTDGNANTTANIVMTGCGQFLITVIPSASFDPSDEAPTKFTATNQVQVTYPGWSVSGPSVSNTSNTSTLTKNGGGISPTCPAAALTNNGASVPATYNYCVDIAAPVAGDIYCTNITATPQTGIVDKNGVILSSSGTATASPACATVTNKPFFKVYNSSVSTGGDVGKCTSDTGALSGFFNNVDSSNGYGASAQLGTYALAHISGFASNQTTNTRSPSELAFANTRVTPTGLIGSPNRTSAYLGGELTGKRCITGIAGSPDGTPLSFASGGQINLVPILSPGGGQPPVSQYNQNLVIFNGPSNKTVKYDKNIAIYVTGDVYISDNIVYDQAGWSIGSVPSFVLSVTGNIYIDPSVTQLDGSYQAAGNIYTCAKDNGGGSFAPITAGSLYSQCNNQLTVTGSFIAKKLNLLRTYGSLRDDATGLPVPCNNAGSATTTHTTCAAEVFEFSPEQYLANPATRQAGGGAIQYDAITSLPPVL